MGPFDEHCYVPILQCKRGEQMALDATPAVVADFVRPLLEVPEPEWDYDAQAPKKTVAEHLAKLPAGLAECWSGRPAFIDANVLSDGALPSGHHPLDWLIDNATSLGTPLTPVVTMSSTDAYVDAASRWADTAGVCLRLAPTNWPSVDLQAVEDLLSDLGVGPTSAHLVLDLLDDVGTFAGRGALAELQSLPYVGDWASVTVAATSLTQMPSGGSTIHTIPRQEWRIYNALCATPLPRIPSFGDYGIQGGGPPLDLDPKLMSISATLRYTAADDFLISKGALYKGAGGRGQGGKAIPAAAQALINHPDYFGQPHCSTELWLTAAAAGGPPGNPTTWRRVGTVHHLQVVTDQLASLHGP